MSLYDIKPRFQALLRPLCGHLAARGVTANAMTLATIGVCAVPAAAIVTWPAAGWPLLLLALVIPVRLAMNAIDGMLAREHTGATPQGALLNETADGVCDLVCTLPLLLVPSLPWLLVALAIVVGVATETIGLASATIGAGRRFEGPLGKPDRAVLIAVMALLAGLGIGPSWLSTLILSLIILLGIATVVRRASAALAAVPASTATGN